MSKRDTKENMMPKRSRRIKYTQEQLEVLERAFEDNHYPDTLQQENLALELDVTFDRISVWFQNRRSRFKRQRQEEHLSYMRKQIYRDVIEMNYGTSGTPKLQSLLSACHVLSPIESNIGRGDSPDESSRTNQLADTQQPNMIHKNEMSVSKTPPCLYPWQMSQTQYMYYPSGLSSTCNVYATPTRPPPPYQTTPNRTSSRVPFTNQTQQDWYPAFIPSNVPSLHSITYNQTTRSPQHQPSYHDKTVTRKVPQRQPSHENTSAFTQQDIVIYPRTDSAVTTPPESAIYVSEDAEGSPSKNALDFLAQWC